MEIMNDRLNKLFEILNDKEYIAKINNHPSIKTKSFYDNNLTERGLNEIQDSVNFITKLRAKFKLSGIIINYDILLSTSNKIYFMLCYYENTNDVEVDITRQLKSKYGKPLQPFYVGAGSMPEINRLFKYRCAVDSRLLHEYIKYVKPANKHFKLTIEQLEMYTNSIREYTELLTTIESSEVDYIVNNKSTLTKEDCKEMIDMEMVTSELFSVIKSQTEDAITTIAYVFTSCITRLNLIERLYNMPDFITVINTMSDSATRNLLYSLEYQISDYASRIIQKLDKITAYRLIASISEMKNVPIKIDVENKTLKIGVEQDNFYEFG